MLNLATNGYYCLAGLMARFVCGQVLVLTQGFDHTRRLNSPSAGSAVAEAREIGRVGHSVYCCLRRHDLRAFDSSGR
jgi:hypothetical protein